jgi:uncharacterized protein (DUF2147 family)
MRILTVPLLLLATVAATPALAATPVTGTWLTVEKDSMVEIAPCGDKICGRISRILAPTPKGPPRDTNNPNPALRNRPIQGLTILSNFVSNGKQWQGSIYDPRRGRTFKSFLELMPNGTLQVKGCVAFYCQSQTWTRAR